MSERRPTSSEPMYCQRCGTSSICSLVRTVCRNGAVRAWFRCPEKGHRVRDIKHAALWDEYGLAAIDLPTVPNHANDPIPCEVHGCDSEETELHHFFPRHIRGVEVASLWPVAFLCRKHHAEWHELVEGRNAWRRSARVPVEGGEQRCVNPAG